MFYGLIFGQCCMEQRVGADDPYGSLQFGRFNDST